MRAILITGLRQARIEEIPQPDFLALIQSFLKRRWLASAGAIFIILFLNRSAEIRFTIPALWVTNVQLKSSAPGQKQKNIKLASW